MRRLGLIVGLVTLLCWRPSTGSSQSVPTPLEMVRRFCQADGMGDRLRPRSWDAIEPLVRWTLEPAWDRVMVISGYQIQPPRFVTDHVEIAVDYTVIREVSAAADDELQMIETVTFALSGDDRMGWQINGPPPVPHVFATAIDVAETRASLQPDATDYMSASAFVWRMLTDAGWNVPYRPVSKLRDPGVFAVVEEPRAGDLALYLADNVPYHVGFVTAEDLVASATLNEGLMQTSPEAFDGTLLYLRLAQSARAASASPSVSILGSEASPAAAVRRPTPPPPPRPTINSKMRQRPKKSPTRKVHPKRRPSPSLAKPRQRATPAATPTRLSLGKWRSVTGDW